MINQDYFKAKQITVVGLARSGFACAVLLHQLGAEVSVTEQKKDVEVADYLKKMPA